MEIKSKHLANPTPSINNRLHLKNPHLQFDPPLSSFLLHWNYKPDFYHEKAFIPCFYSTTKNYFIMKNFTSSFALQLKIFHFTCKYI